ncbi:hypothetical protein QFC20_005903 [Naganishia adeliensis]|uniref:Uncharacterized protein n=1 Tax=Naganishia adeliensis TaxID=92952 RepID=A0ACC2VIX6_9TREE|nr:hypothetical protein QFC20_005903 [Naganishia adeliensis]
MPIVSSSLSSTLKASVTLDQRGTYCTVRVHLYAQYEYSMLDMAGVWRTLDVARSLPGFESISDININVLSNPGEAAPGLVGPLNVSPDSDIEEEGDEDDDDASDDAVDPFAILPTPPIDGWLKSINLNIDDSVKLEIHDYIILSTHMMAILRPYAVMRLEKEDEKMECAAFRMFGLQTDVLLAFTASYMRLCSSDPLYATLEVTFDLLYTEDDEDDVAELQPEDVFGVLTLLALTAKNFKQASKTIPLKLLRGYLAWNEPEWFIASVKVDADKKEMKTSFHYGFEDMINKVEKLEDVATTVSAGRDA